jgi:phospholipid transport system substrate-binding protein
VGDARRATCARLAAALLTAMLALPQTAAAAESPRQVVESLTNAVLVVLRDGGLSDDEKRRRIEEIAYATIDFSTVSRLVLARNWKRLSPPQQDEFVHEFKRHLSVTYGDNVRNYKDETVSVVGDRAEARGDWTVQTKVNRPTAEDVLVDYRLRQRDGRWQIIDVIIEGVSLVSNFRSQFQEIVANGGPERLLELLREKNAKGEPLKS